MASMYTSAPPGKHGSSLAYFELGNAEQEAQRAEARLAEQRRQMMQPPKPGLCDCEAHGRLVYYSRNGACDWCGREVPRL
jgi:hypothetical protein